MITARPTDGHEMAGRNASRTALSAYRRWRFRGGFPKGGGYGGATRVRGEFQGMAFMGLCLHLKFNIANLKVGWKFKIAI